MSQLADMQCTSKPAPLYDETVACESWTRVKDTLQSQWPANQDRIILEALIIAHAGWWTEEERMSGRRGLKNMGEELLTCTWQAIKNRLSALKYLTQRDWDAADQLCEDLALEEDLLPCGCWGAESSCKECENGEFDEE